MEAFVRDLEKILEVPEGSLAAETRLSELESWDSLGQVSFLAYAEETRGALLNGEKLGDCATVADLHGLLGQRSEAV